MKLSLMNLSILTEVECGGLGHVWKGDHGPVIALQSRLSRNLTKYSRELVFFNSVGLAVWNSNTHSNSDNELKIISKIL